MKIYKIKAIINGNSEVRVPTNIDLEFIINEFVKDTSYDELFKNNLEDFLFERNSFIGDYGSNIDEYLEEAFKDDDSKFVFNKKQIKKFINNMNNFIYYKDETYYCGYQVIEYSVNNVDFKNFFLIEEYSIPQKQIKSQYLLASGPDNVSDITNKINKLKDFT